MIVLALPSLELILILLQGSIVDSRIRFRESAHNDVMIFDVMSYLIMALFLDKSAMYLINVMMFDVN